MYVNRLLLAQSYNSILQTFMWFILKQLLNTFHLLMMIYSGRAIFIQWTPLNGITDNDINRLMESD
jgi:hypothetical protein